MFTNVKSNAGHPRGILNLKAGEDKFQLCRRLPATDLALFVAHYWTVTWDLTGKPPHVQETLPHPSVVLVIEAGRSRIAGVMTGKFSRLLENKGRVFGIKFRPGAFYPFVNRPVSGFTDGALSLQEVFGRDGEQFEKTMLALADEARMVATANAFIRARLPQRDGAISLINNIVDEMAGDRSITRVDDVVRRFRISKRNLQRIFNQYVGVSPKWVIRRYRLHEAVAQLADGNEVDWPQLALNLGYFDQAHFIKDFKAIIAMSPAEYANKIGKAK